jgi:dethiobiotin synthetase
MNFHTLFVAGTDTGVGKTLVTALIALRLRQLGIDCGVMKPFASGCERVGGALVSEDATFLREALQLDDSHDEICPIRLEEPLAPLIAARRAGIPTQEWPEMARAAYERLRARHECVIVEGVGGLFAPIWEDAGVRTNEVRTNEVRTNEVRTNEVRTNEVRTNKDLIESWGLPTVLVARRTLGTINHTLLSLNLALKEPAYFAGLVFNDPLLVEGEDVAAETSPQFIGEQTPVPIWGQVPFATDLRREELERLAARIEVPGSGRA